jgi:tight adherence protein B
VIESTLPASGTTLRWVGALGLGLTLGLFLFILVSGRSDDDIDNFTKRLAAYGRGGQTEEKRSLLERIPLLGRFTAKAEEDLKQRGLLGAINNTLEQGNVPLTAGEAIAAGFGLSAVIGLIVGLVRFDPIPGLVAFILSIFLVFMIINFVGGREVKKFESQLPDTLTLLSTSLRAGYSLLQAVEAVAAEAPNPTSREFGRAIAEARLGVPVVDAMTGITRRTQSKDFEWAVMAIEIQREVGGNLAEVLQTVADTMLARNRLKGEIKALTAEGRISAVVLGSLPFAMTLFLWTSNRSYLMPLFENTFGLIAVGVGLVLIAAGIFWLRKIIDIEV